MFCLRLFCPSDSFEHCLALLTRWRASVHSLSYYFLCDPRRCDNSRKVRAPKCDSVLGTPHVVTWTKHHICIIWFWIWLDWPAGAWSENYFQIIQSKGLGSYIPAETTFFTLSIGKRLLLPLLLNKVYTRYVPDNLQYSTCKLCSIYIYICRVEWAPPSWYSYHCSPSTYIVFYIG